MILDSKFEQLVQRNFLRSSQEYDLAKYFWTKAERAMQQKPTQQPTLTTKSLPEGKRTYVTDELAKYFAGTKWTIPQWVQDRESDERDYVNYMQNQCFTRSELQSIQANNRKLIGNLEFEIQYWFQEYTKHEKELKAICNLPLTWLETKEIPEFNWLCNEVDHNRNKVSSTKLKLKKLVTLQTKIKRLLAN